MGDVEMSEESRTTGLEIAVIGMAGRFPGAGNIHEFWENLKNGVESIAFFADGELLEAGVKPRYLEDPAYVGARGFLEGSEYFDAVFFGYTPAEAAVMDPQLRFFHECAWEALEDAGCDPDMYEGLIGVYFGASANLQWKIRVFANGASGGNDFAESLLSSTDLLATRLSYQLNLTGPSTTINSACSTSLVAIHRACRGLLGGECDIALAGGVSIAVPQKEGYFYREGMIDSPDGHCRAFDVRANGTLFGSGIGVVSLKRLDEAIEEGNHIHAVIKGSAVNNDGKRKVGYTAPSVEGQGDVIRAACQVAEVEPDSIGYIETHGTGTTLGDPIEIKALVRGMKRNAADRCAIGTVKTNIGHLDAASGAAGFIKTVLCLRHRLIPPTLHFNTPNPELELAKTPFYVNTELLEWERQKDRPRRAAVSSFGIGGTNAHVILEEAPVIGENKTGKEREYQLMLLSAKTAPALDKMSQNLAEHLKTHPNIELGDVAYTLQKGRQAFVHRKALVCSTVDEAIEALSNPGSPSPAIQTMVSTGEYRTIVFMFPGQGSQYVNMGLELYQNEPVFREELDRCFEIIKPLMAPMLGVPIKEILYPHDLLSKVSEVSGGIPKNINQTEITQPLIFAFEYALAKLLMSWGITPDAMIGHSIGEYAAACLSGVFSLEGALNIVVQRGKLMQQVPGGAMLSVSLPEQQLEPLLVEHPGLALAAVNSSSLCVVSGPHEAIEGLEKELNRKNHKNRRLHTSHAFHSPMMDTIVKPFEAAVGKVTPAKPDIPFLSNVTGDWVTVPDAVDPRYWARHLRQTVRFSDGLAVLLGEKNRIFLEVGPGSALSTFVRRHKDKKAHQVVIDLVRHPRKQESDIGHLLYQTGRLWLCRQKIDWQAFHHGNKRCLVSLPTYPFAGKRYWIDEEAFKSFLEDIAREQVTRKDDMGEWFYLPSWKRSGLAAGPVPLPGVCLIFSQAYGPGEGLAGKLGQAGVDTVVINRGTGFERQSGRRYSLDPREAGHYDMLMAGLYKENRVPRWIIHLWNVTEENEYGGLTIEKSENAQYTGFYSLVYLARALGSRGSEENLQILVVSNHMQEVTGEAVRCPEKAVVLGPVKVIPREYPNICCRSVDIDMPVQGDGDAHEKWLIRQLIMEMTAAATDSEVAYRRNLRWVRVFEPIPLKGAGDGVKPPYLKEKGVYLITGGLGGIGLVLAGHLARQVKAKLVLTGRSGQPDRQQGGRLRELEEMGAEVLVMAADAADREQMAAVVRQASERFGPIDGVIHAAGIADYGGIIQGRGEKEKAILTEAVLAPKVKGTIILQRLLQDRGIAPDFIVLCSSLASLKAPFGEVAYSSANAFLDAYAHYYNKYLAVDRYPSMVYSINWSGWQQVGMAVEAVKRKEEDPAVVLKDQILPAEGIEAFDRILSSEFAQVAVSPLDLNLLLKQKPGQRGDYFDTSVEMESEPSPQPFHQRPVLHVLYAPPENETQQKLVQIWQRFFGLEQVGIDDDFFDLGGDSLKAMAVTGFIQKEFHSKLTLAELFKTPTIRKLAQYIREAEQTNFIELEKAEEREFYPLSYSQQRLYILHQLNPASSAYNMSKRFLLNEEVDEKIVKGVLKTLVERHAGLRTGFKTVNHETVQFVVETMGLPFRVQDISAVPAEEKQRKWEKVLADLTSVPFDLETLPLFRAVLVKLGSRQYDFMFSVHHIVADGWSLEIVQKEFLHLYREYRLGQPVGLEPLPFQYTDFSWWYNRQLESGTDGKNPAAEFWEQKLAGGIPALQLPVDFTEGGESAAGAGYQCMIGEDLKRHLDRLAEQYHTTLFTVMFSVYLLVLFKISNQEDIGCSIIAAGRDHISLRDIVGLFVNSILFNVHIDSDETFERFLQRMNEDVVQALQYQAHPLEPVFEALNMRFPDVSVSFNMLNMQDITGGRQLEPFEGFHVVDAVQDVKFDLEPYITEYENGIWMWWVYRKSLFEPATIEYIINLYINLLEFFARDSFRSLRDHIEEEKKQKARRFARKRQHGPR
jgi:acyl transferase domain-containing protein/acyl carrier protein